MKPDYLKGFIAGLRKAIDVAFYTEAKYAPSAADTDCCKCDTSHAKADGAAEVVDTLQAFLSLELDKRRKK